MGLVSSRKHPEDLPTFRHYQEAATVKSVAFMEYIDKQHPSTHQPMLFRANISF
jgi:hypothetical protein